MVVSMIILAMCFILTNQRPTDLAGSLHQKRGLEREATRRQMWQTRSRGLSISSNEHDWEESSRQT